MKKYYKYGILGVIAVVLSAIIFPHRTKETTPIYRTYEEIMQSGVLRAVTEYNSISFYVTEDTIEAVANTSYELTFALFALGLFIFMKAKKVKFGPVPQHKDKILAAVFETAGQFTYVYALGGVDAVAAPILSSVCVVSLLLSRIFLKEKLSWKTYAFIAVVIIGILLLAISEEL